MLPHAVGDLYKPDKVDTGDGGMKQTSCGVHVLVFWSLKSPFKWFFIIIVIIIIIIIIIIMFFLFCSSYCQKSDKLPFSLVAAKGA